MGTAFEQCGEMKQTIIICFLKFLNKKFAKPEILEIEPINVFSINTEREVEERIEKGIEDADTMPHGNMHQREHQES